MLLIQRFKIPDFVVSPKEVLPLLGSGLVVGWGGGERAGEGEGGEIGG